MDPAFIICAPRSGTTWLLRALNAHPDVYATEVRAFGQHVDLVQDDGARKPRLRVTLDEYVDALLNPHQWEPLGSSRDAVRDELLGGIYTTIQRHALKRSGKQVFIDKLTPYLGTADRALDAIGRLFPSARVIMLLRDGRDVAISGVMHWLTKSLRGAALSDQQRTRRHFFLENTGPPPDRFVTDVELEEWARLWREPIDAIAARSPGLKPLVVCYEDMSRDMAAELMRICEFIGVDATPPVAARCVSASTFEVMSGGRQRGHDAPGQHVRKGVVGDWRAYFTAADAALFDRLAGDLLIQWGYEPGREWTTRRPERLQLDREQLDGSLAHVGEPAKPPPLRHHGLR